MNSKLLCALIADGEDLLSKVSEGMTQWGVDEWGNEGDFPLEYVFTDYNDYEKYDLWIKKVIRYLSNHHKDEYLSNEFIQESKKVLWRPTFSNMINILKAHEGEEYELKQQISSTYDNGKIFIVHGHDAGLKNEIARFLETLEFEAIILHEQPNQGSTIIEKIERNTDVGFAIVLYTPCDIGAVKNKAASLNKRARQNVVFEHGYLIAKLGRNRVCALLSEKEIETPGDISGVIYIMKDDAGAWKMQIIKEMKAAGYKIDTNKFL